MQWLRKLWSRLTGPAKTLECPPWFKPDGYRDFVGVVEAELKQRGLAFEMRDGSVLVKGLPAGQPCELGLTNVSQACAQAPRGEWPVLVRRHFDIVLKGAPDLGPIDRFENAEKVLKVRLHPDSMLGHNTPLVHRKVATGLIATLVYDLPDTVTTVHPDHMKAWPVSVDEAFAIGLAHVRDEVKVERSAVPLKDDTALTVFSSGSFFAASRALMLADTFGAESVHGFLVGVPHRHMVVAHPVTGVDVVVAVNAMVPALISLHQQGPGSITPNLYWVRAQHWVHLPAKVVDKALQVRPPEEFVVLMNRLADPPRQRLD